MRPESRLRLEQFVARVRQLESYSILQNRERIAGFTLKRDAAGELQPEYFAPSDEARDALVLSLRLFLQRNDNVSFDKLAELEGDPGLTVEWKRGVADQCRQKDAYLERFFTHDGEGPVLLRDVLDMVLYGVLTHSNPRGSAYRRYHALVKDNETVRGLVYDSFWAAVVTVMAVAINIARITEVELARPRP